MRTDLAERAERRFLLLVRCLWVLERADEQGENLADKGDEVLARDAPQQPNAFDHVSGYDGLRVFGLGEEDVEEGVRVWLDEAVGGRKKRREHLSSHDSPLPAVLLLAVSPYSSTSPKVARTYTSVLYSSSVKS